MIAVDTQILVYAHRRDSPFHEQARETVSGLAEGLAAWALPWPCIHEFLAVVTHPRIYDPPSSWTAARAQVDAWLESPTISLLSETADHWSKLTTLAQKAAVTGPRIHDARVAALCMAHGVRELYSVDRDFSRFPALRTKNPLEAA